MMKRNEGFTLIELILAISIGTIITAAVLSVLLFGMRINLKTTASVQQVNATNMLTQMVQSITEEQSVNVSNEYTIEGANGFKLTFENGSILLNNTVFMEDIEDFTAKLSDDHRQLTVTIKAGGKNYTATTYCRLNPTPIPDEGGSTE